MIIYFLFQIVTTLDCQFNLQSPKGIQLTNGVFDATITTTITSNYIVLQYSTNWSQDATTAIASATFQCSVASQNCIGSANQQRCNNVNTIGTYTVTCVGVNTPSFSGVNQGTFDVFTYNAANTELENCKGQTLSGFVPGKITQGQLNVVDASNTNNNAAVNMKSFAVIKFTLESSISPNDFILVTLNGYQFETFDSTCTAPIFTFSTCVPQTVSQTTTQLPIKLTTGKTNKNSEFVVSLMSVRTSPMSKPNTINLITYRTVPTNIIDSLTTLFTYTPTLGSLQITSIKLSSSIVNVQSIYEISVVITNPLTSSGYFRIKIPDNLIITDFTCSASINSISQVGTCTTNSGDVLIKNALASAPIAGATVKLSIKFINVPTSNLEATFTSIISYYDTNDQSVDQYTSSFKVTSYQPATIGNIGITTSSLKVGDTSDITFTFNNINIIPQEAYIKLLAPTEVNYISSSQCVLQSVTVSCTFDSATGTLRQLFTADIPAATSLTITIKSAFRNPYTLQPTSPSEFSLSIFDKNNVPLDRKLLFGQVTMTTQSGLDVALSRDSTKNGELTNYRFAVKFETTQIQNSLLILQLPGFTFGSVSVTTDGSQLSTSLVSSVFGDIIKITMNNQIAPGSTVTFVISNIRNPDSYKASNAISALTRTSNDQYGISTYTGTLTVVNNQVNSITITSMIQSVGLLGEIDTYTIQFNTINTMVTSLKVTLPVQITYASADCLIDITNTQGFTISQCQYLSSVMTLTLASVGSTQQYSMTINNLLNPVSIATNIYLSLATFRETFSMDATQVNDPQLKFNIKCTLPCRTCSGTCTSCYKSNVNTLNYLSNGQCLASCPDTYYNDNFICKKCTNNCEVCNATECTKCAALYTKVNGLCSMLCTVGQYEQGTTCQTCDTNCKTCEIRADKCTSCNNIQFIYLDKCISTCPQPLYQVANTCVSCQSPCKSCNLSPTECKECLSNYLLKIDKCVLSCGDNYYTSNTQCLQCQQPCNNCEDATNCKDCSQSQGARYLKDKQCLSACPAQYYTSGLSCLQCSILCQNCTTLDTCISCPIGKFLLNSKCIDACPVSYFSSNQVCYQCDSSCINCQSLSLCTKCQSGKYTVSGKCLDSCPLNYYIQQQECIACDASCKECNSTGCTICPTGRYKYETTCITQCPPASYIKDNTCILCDTGCNKCDAIICTVCSDNYVKYNNNCLPQCPDKYENKSGICELIVVDTKIDQVVADNLQNNKYIPVPFTIGLMIISLFVAVGKMQKHETFIPGAMIGLGGMLTMGSWVTLYFLIGYSLDYQVLLLMAAGAAHLILNLINLLLIYCCLHTDIEFQQWRQSSQNSLTYIILTFLSILTFTTTRLYISRLFGFKFFKAKVTTIDQLSPLSVINGLAVLTCCFPAGIASVIIAYNDTLREQLFVSAIDAFIVTTLLAICLIWETQKDETYFDDTNYKSLNQSQRLVPDFFQTRQSAPLNRFSFEEVSENPKIKQFEDLNQYQEPSFPIIHEIDSQINVKSSGIRKQSIDSDQLSIFDSIDKARMTSKVMPIFIDDEQIQIFQPKQDQAEEVQEYNSQNGDPIEVNALEESDPIETLFTKKLHNNFMHTDDQVEQLKQVETNNEQVQDGNIFKLMNNNKIPVDVQIPEQIQQIEQSQQQSQMQDSNKEQQIGQAQEQQVEQIQEQIEQLTQQPANTSGQSTMPGQTNGLEQSTKLATKQAKLTQSAQLAQQDSLEQLKQSQVKQQSQVKYNQQPTQQTPQQQQQQPQQPSTQQPSQPNNHSPIHPPNKKFRQSIKQPQSYDPLQQDQAMHVDNPMNTFEEDSNIISANSKPTSFSILDADEPIEPQLPIDDSEFVHRHFLNEEIEDLKLRVEEMDTTQTKDNFRHLNTQQKSVIMPSVSSEPENDWVDNQISPTQFNVLNQRYPDVDDNNQNFQRVEKCQSSGQYGGDVIVPVERFQSDDFEDYHQESMFSQFAKNHPQRKLPRKQSPQKTDDKTNKIYLQRLSNKQPNSIMKIQQFDF